LENSWIVPLIILGALAVLIAANILEFRSKRKRDAEELAQVAQSDRPELRLAHRQYLQTQNIEQVLHIVSSVLIALLIAVLVT